jgi:hypothetical protein
MKWKVFRELSVQEKYESLTKKPRSLKTAEKFLREAEECGIKLPKKDIYFAAGQAAWQLCSIANTLEKMDRFLKRRFNICGQEFFAPHAALVNGSLWPELFYGFRNRRGEFIPGLVPQYFMDGCDDPVESFLIYTDLSGMTVDEAVAELSKIVPSISSTTLRKRISSWDK